MTKLKIVMTLEAGAPGLARAAGQAHQRRKTETVSTARRRAAA